MLTIKHHHHQDLDQFHLIPPLQSLKAVNFCFNFLMGQPQSLFIVFKIYRTKTVDLINVRTQTVEVKGKHADH